MCPSVLGVFFSRQSIFRGGCREAESDPQPRHPEKSRIDRAHEVARGNVFVDRVQQVQNAEPSGRIQCMPRNHGMAFR